MSARNSYWNEYFLFTQLEARPALRHLCAFQGFACSTMLFVGWSAVVTCLSTNVPDVSKLAVFASVYNVICNTQAAVYELWSLAVYPPFTFVYCVQLKYLTTLFRRNRSSASDFAYSYPFLRSVVCRLSVVCHTRASCLNRSTDLHATRQVHLRGPMTHCHGGSLIPQGKRKFGGRTSRQNMQLQIAAPCQIKRKRFRLILWLLVAF